MLPRSSESPNPSSQQRELRRCMSRFLIVLWLRLYSFGFDDADDWQEYVV